MPEREPLILAHTSIVGDIRTEFFIEAEGGPAVLYRKTCLICKIADTFGKPRFGDDFDTFAKHSAFAGLLQAPWGALPRGDNVLMMKRLAERLVSWMQALTNNPWYLP